MPKRPVSKGAEALLEVSQPVLDKGFVRLVDYMGNDAAIVQAARVSYGEGTKSIREDEGLIRYLWKNKHTSPFEMLEVKLHCKMPIFVARQWVRHRTAALNEVSARYSEMKEEFYVPEIWRLQGGKGGGNRQGSAGELNRLSSSTASHQTKAMANATFRLYTQLLHDGVAREQARMVLPVNLYTEWYWKIDLHNLLHFLTLRTDDHAQWEIRQYACAIALIVEAWVPVVSRVWMEGLGEGKG